MFSQRHVSLHQQRSGFNLQRNLNIVVSAYWMVPHCATRFLILFYLIVMRHSCHMFYFYLGMLLENYLDALSSHIEKMFEIFKKLSSVTVDTS